MTRPGKEWSRSQAVIVRKLALIADEALTVSHIIKATREDAASAFDRQFVRSMLIEAEKTLRMRPAVVV